MQFSKIKVGTVYRVARRDCARARDVIREADKVRRARGPLGA